MPDQPPPPRRRFTPPGDEDAYYAHKDQLYADYQQAIAEARTPTAQQRAEARRRHTQWHAQTFAAAKNIVRRAEARLRAEGHHVPGRVDDDLVGDGYHFESVDHMFRNRRYAEFQQALAAGQEPTDCQRQEALRRYKRDSWQRFAQTFIETCTASPSPDPHEDERNNDA